MKTDSRPDGPMARSCNGKPERQVEAHGAWCDKGGHLRTPGVSGEPLSQVQERSSMSPPLDISSNGDTTERCDRAGDVDSNHANVLALVDKELRIVVRRLVVRMIGVVHAEPTASLEQHLTTNSVKAFPLNGRGWRDELVTFHRPDWLTDSRFRCEH
jgi:hypothetical protein